MLMLGIDQMHGVRAHHDWWWDMTWPQAAVLIAFVLAGIAWAAIHAWSEVRDDELRQRRLEFNVREGIVR